METIRGLLGKKKEEHPRLLTIFEQLNAEFREDIIKKRKHLASNPKFNAFIVALIFVNTIVIGVEVDNTRGSKLSDRLVYFILEFCFAIVFFFEMLIRINQLSWDYFVDPWNVFDYSLVVLSCSDIVVSVTKDDSESGGMRLASSLRIFRLLRVVRSIKGLKIVAGLWLIIQGILDSVRTVFWVACSCFIIIYCLAVALTTIAGHETSVREHWRLADVYVGSVSRSMITLLQVITLDSWTSDIARPLMGVAPITLGLLIIAITVLTFGTLNILVAVMVERISCIAQDSKDTSSKVLERTENTLLHSMAEDFRKADKDNSGDLEFKEFRRMIRTKSMNSKLSLLGIRIDEAESLFELMDVDKSGTVTPQEFISGLQKVKGNAKGQDVVQLICFSQKQCLRATRFVERLHLLNDKADEIQKRLNKVGKSLSTELGYRKKAGERNDETWQRVAQKQQVLLRLDKDRQLDYPGLNGADGDLPGSYGI
ncbi:unnamed protein product [Polarella glacialis]|uniref:EF-hand domain-containing protein n=1 Tax=Polarella glacialis TaxID=89957 RepID=A0A813I5F4_POLGL|nr:unnamed protein product [Polarella glacialis]